MAAGRSRSDWPWVLVAAEQLLRAARFVLALAAIPSYALLRLCIAVASAACFQDAAPGSRHKHAALALPRLAAVLAAAPAAALGPAVAAELLVRGSGLGWPPSVAAILGAALTLHGVWFVQHHPSLPEPWKLELGRLRSSLAGTLYDLLCLCALCFLAATVVRVPALLRDLCGLPSDAPRGAARWRACCNAALVPVDVLCLPAAALVVVCFWRLRPAWEGIHDSSSVIEGRLRLFGHALGALLDVLVACLAAPLLLNPLRLANALRGCAGEGSSDWRVAVFDQLVLLLFDILCLPVLLALVAMPWRLALALRQLCRRERDELGSYQLQLLRHACFGVADVLGVGALLLVAVMRPHRLWGSEGRDYSLDRWEAGEAQLKIFWAFAVLLLDVFTCAVPAVVVVATLYRLPVLVAGLRESNWWRCFVWQQATLVLLELPLLILSLCLAAVPWRLFWLIGDLLEASSSEDVRNAMIHHVLLALADLASLVTLVALLATAPHRLFSKRFRWCLRSGLQAHNLGVSVNKGFRHRRPRPRVPKEGTVITAFHGTTADCARAIKREGFRPSSNGMLGPGVYISRDLSKAESYGDGTVLTLKVAIGKVTEVDRQGHPDQKDWPSKGFGAAWVPAGCGMVQSNREEGCIADPAMITVLGEFEKAGHPRCFIMKEAFDGIADLMTCFFPFIVVLLTVYRLPALWRYSQEEGSTAWGIRCFCFHQATQVVLDVVAAACFLVLMVASPWRCILVCYDACVGCLGLRCHTLKQLLLALLDPLCAAALLAVVVTGIRLPVLRASLERSTDLSCGCLRGYLRGGLDAQCALLRLFSLLLLDLLVLVGILLVALLIVRLPSFCRRAAAMVQALQQQVEPTSLFSATSAPAGSELAPCPASSPAEEDARRGRAQMELLDGEGSSTGLMTLTFFQELVVEELVASVVSLPLLLLAPVVLLLPASRLVERYGRWRFASKCRPAVASESAEVREQPVCSPNRDLVDSSTVGAGACALPHSIWLAAPVPALLSLSSSSSSLAELEAQVLASIMLLLLLLLHELATAVFLLFCFVAILPQTLFFILWPSTCRESEAGKTALAVAHLVQVLLLSPTLALRALLLCAPVIANWWVPLDLFTFKTLEEGVLPLGAVVALQVVWLTMVAASFEMLAAASGHCGYKPLKGCTLLAVHVLGLVTGKSAIWQRVLDPCFGAFVHCCYRHRRSCCCVGELFLGVGLLSFVTWPAALAALQTLVESKVELGALAAWWAGAVMATVFLLFHAVRISKAHWRAQPKARGGLPLPGRGSGSCKGIDGDTASRGPVLDLVPAPRGVDWGKDTLRSGASASAAGGSDLALAEIPTPATSRPGVDEVEVSEVLPPSRQCAYCVCWPLPWAAGIV